MNRRQLNIIKDLARQAREHCGISLRCPNSGENVVSRTFQVLNLDGNIGSKYRPYPSNSDELRVLWLDAEEL